MRVAITINTSWNIYNFRAGLIKRLIDRGDEVFAVAPIDEYSQKLIEMGCKFEPIEIDNTGSNPLNDIQLYFQLLKVYKKIAPDIIYQYTVKPNIYGTLAANRLNIPTINNVSGLGTVFLTRSITNVIAKWLYRISFKNATLIFFQNADDQKDFLQEIDLFNVETDLLPGSGIDLVKFYSQKPLQSKPFVFLMIARIIIDKGVMEYLEAAKMVKERHPDAVFQLIGPLDEGHARGINSSAIMTYVDSGVLSYMSEQSNVIAFIEQSSCVVLPSYREGTPKTLLEAAALSRPLIATNVPGCKEVIVNQENGLLCEVKNVESLTQSMLEMLNKNHQTLCDMGKMSRKLVESKFDEKIVIDSYISHSIKILNQIN